MPTPAAFVPVTHSNYTVKAIISVGLLLILSVLVYLSYKYRDSKQASALKADLVLATTKQPENFTELYFTDHTQLPKVIERHKIYNFSFTIHNLENKEVDYPYLVYLEKDGLTLPIDQGEVTIGNNEYAPINIAIGPLAVSRKKIVVELTGRNQLISFWVD